MTWPEAFFYAVLVLSFFGVVGLLIWRVTRDD